MERIIRENYTRIKEETARIIEDELYRIADDPKLKKLLKQPDKKSRQKDIHTS